jgi:sulfite reductase (ferredoxin)
MPDAAQPAKPSKVEGVKRDSRRLRGAIAETIADGQAIKFADPEVSLLKFHGVYQQYDRDTATERKQQKLEKDYRFMIRLRIPAGRLSAEQYLALDDFAGRLANGTLRVTTRQTFQFHGVLKGELHELIHRINGEMITTVAACGDVVRNVTATPAPIKDVVHETLDRVAGEVSRHFEPRTRGYHEIWVDGEKVEADAGAEAEPIYGEVYLPRKFKIGLATPQDNSIDVLTNDIGIIALFDGQTLTGYNLAVGGGLGMTHNKPHTYPRLATPLIFVEPDGLIGALEAIVKLQRDHGNRSDRKRARLKYVVDDMGLEWMRATVEAYAGRSYEDPRPMPKLKIVDHLGWHSQGDGKWYLGVPVASGRIGDFGGERVRSGLRAVIDRFRPNIVLSPSQDVILADIAPKDRKKVEALLREHGVVLSRDLKPFERWALACPALPTCGLALSEAERVRQPLVDGVMARLSAHGLETEKISFRITGCPNGCARPYAGDIGLVGRMPGHYALYVGGDFEGTRLNFKLLDKVAEGEVAAVLNPLFAAFAEGRKRREGFGDFCHRMGPERLTELIDDARAKEAA